MSGPQGPDANQPWPGQQPNNDPAWQQPGTPEQPTTAAPVWPQAPAYQPQQYPQYQPPGPPVQPAYPPYPQGDQYGQPPGGYNPSVYPQAGQPAAPTQYGQPAQYGQAPQYGQQPDQYGQQFTPYGSSGSDEGSKKSLALVGGIVGLLLAVIVAVVLVLGFWKPGFFVTTKLDVTAAQTGVAQILSDEANGYGAKNVQNVTCNNGQSPTVKKGDTFDCEVSIDGTKRQVTVTFQDDNGTYEVGRPK